MVRAEGNLGATPYIYCKHISWSGRGVDKIPKSAPSVKGMLKDTDSRLDVGSLEAGFPSLRFT